MREPLPRARRPAALLLALPALVIAAGLALWPLLLALWPLVASVVPPWLVPPTARSPVLSADGLSAEWLPAEGLPALGRQLVFSALVLALELPLGLVVAIALPRRGFAAAAAVAVVAWPLAIPQSVADLLRTEGVPRAWDALARALASWGVPPWQMPAGAVDWLGYVLVDVWRFTPFVALLCAHALRQASPLERAARIDGLDGWQRLRYVHWPRARHALALAATVRFLDSLNAWSHPGSLVSFPAFLLERAASGNAPLAGLGTAVVLLFLWVAPARRFVDGGRGGSG